MRILAPTLNFVLFYALLFVIYIQEIFFIGPIFEKLQSFYVYSVSAERGFSCKLVKSKYFENSCRAPLNFVIIVFRNFGLLTAPEVDF
jgi:hypothetical protein